MESVLDNPMVVVTVIVGAAVTLFAYVLTKFLHQDNKQGNKIKNEKVPARPTEKKKEPAAGKNKKKAEPRWSGRSEKQNFSHPWLLTSLKGHTGRVLGMDFAANGKYLASVADEDLEEDPGGTTAESTSSSSSECNKENSRSASPEPSPKLTGLSRRQRKNRKRESEAKKKVKVSNTKTTRKEDSTAKVAPKERPMEEFTSFSMDQAANLQRLMRHYVLRSEDMAIWGFPTLPNRRDMISKNVMLVCNDNFYYEPKKHFFDINAKEFVPKRASPNDSGHSSGSSSEEENCHNVTSRSHNQFNQNGSGVYGRACVRCGTWFYTTQTEYTSQEQCFYHSGVLVESHYVCGEYTCCGGLKGSDGCVTANCHVWNGPNETPVHYTETEELKHHPADGNYGAYSLDCEMCYTVAGLEVTKVTLVGIDGRMVYNEYVRPKNPIVDYNTRYSGITEEDFIYNRSKTLPQVQRDLKKFINSDTVLIGHALENDLKALKLIHKTVVDTTLAFPHYRGFPYKRSLKTLAWQCLRREIQCSESGHDSYEDARTCMELMLFRIKRDFGLYP